MRGRWGLWLVAVLVLLVASCGVGGSDGELSAPTFERPPVATVPSDWVKYADQTAGFEIWYPPDWELLLSQMESMGTRVRTLIDDAPEELLDGITVCITDSSPCSKSAVVFLGGRPTAEGFRPNVSVVVLSLPAEETLDEFIEPSLVLLSQLYGDYELHGQTKVSIGDHDAFLFEYSGTARFLDDVENMCLMGLSAVEGRLGWTLSCNVVEGYRQECESSLLSFRLTG